LFGWFIGLLVYLFGGGSEDKNQQILVKEKSNFHLIFVRCMHG